MSSLIKGTPFPNIFLTRSDGTSLELQDLRKKEHALLVMQQRPDNDLLAFISHFQDEARLFEWLQTRLLVVYPRRESVPSPWPAPAFAPFLYAEPLPQGIEWGQAYVVSKNGTLVEIYAEPALLSTAKIEKDMLYWEANHCLP